tara:strand:- start:112 stop:837 length:726 start_codon:yes stop_codon:yes gene_type:complete
VQIFSNRHKLVGKLVLTSLAITSIFGINSVFFSFSQNKLSESIKNFEALDALKTSTATDEISTIADLKRNYSSCFKNFPINCENYFTALIQTRNRMKDYEITFVETLNLNKNNELYKFLSKVSNETNIVAKESFDMSFEEAKIQKISSASEYIESIKNKNFSLNKYETSNKNLIKSINDLYREINQWVTEDINSSKSIPEIKAGIDFNYFILVISEISLFLLVASIDILNNNIQNQNLGEA